MRRATKWRYTISWTAGQQSIALYNNSETYENGRHTYVPVVRLSAIPSPVEAGGVGSSGNERTLDITTSLEVLESHNVITTLNIGHSL